MGNCHLLSSPTVSVVDIRRYEPLSRRALLERQHELPGIRGAGAVAIGADDVARAAVSGVAEGAELEIAARSGVDRGDRGPAPRARRARHQREPVLGEEPRQALRVLSRPGLLIIAEHPI